MFAGLPEWESTGMSNEKIKLPITANHSLSPKLVWINNSGIRVRFKRKLFKTRTSNFYSKKRSEIICSL